MSSTTNPAPREIAMAALGLWLAIALVHGSMAWGGALAAGGDLVNQLLPMTISWLRHGPGWAPGTFSGHPLFADPQSGILYPPNWLYLPFGESGAPRVMTLLLVAHIWWAGLGTYLLARRWMGAAGAAFAACAWMFGGAYGAKLAAGITVFVFAGAHLPWILHAAHGLFESCTRRRAMGALAVLAGLQILAGAPQIVQITWVGTALWLFAARFRQDGKWTPLAAIAGPAMLCVPFLFGVLIALPQLSASAEYAALAYPRDGGDRWAFVTGDSLQLRHLMHWIFPDFFGSGNSFDYWGSNSGFFDSSNWLGISALIFAAFALVRFFRDERRGSPETPALAVALLGLFLAFGKNSPLFRIFYEIIPTFDAFRVPARWIMWTGFGTVLLAGRGLGLVTASYGERIRLREFLALPAVFCATCVVGILLLPGMLAGVFDVSTALAMRDPALAGETLGRFTSAARGALSWGLVITVGTAAIGAGSLAGRLKPKYAPLLLVVLLFADARRFWAPFHAEYPAEIPPEEVESIERFPRVASGADFASIFYPTKGNRPHQFLPHGTGRFIFTDDVQGWMNDQNAREVQMEIPCALGLESARGYQQLILKSYVEEMESVTGPFESGARVGPFMTVPGIADRTPLDAYNVTRVLTYFELQPIADFAALGFTGGPLRLHPAGLFALDNPHARGWAWLSAGTDWLRAEPVPELGYVQAAFRDGDFEEYRVRVTDPGGAWFHVSSPLHPGWHWVSPPSGAVPENGRTIRLAQGDYVLPRQFAVRQLSPPWLLFSGAMAAIALAAMLVRGRKLESSPHTSQGDKATRV